MSSGDSDVESGWRVSVEGIEDFVPTRAGKNVLQIFLLAASVMPGNALFRTLIAFNPQASTLSALSTLY